VLQEKLNKIVTIQGNAETQMFNNNLKSTF